MQKYSGFREYGYRFKVEIPTTIFEPKVAVIQAYKGKFLVDEIYFRLKKMPEWHVPCQCIMLSKPDEKALEKKTEEIFKKLGLLSRI